MGMVAVTRSPRNLVALGKASPVMDFAAVKQQPLSQTLLVTLREAIISGRLKPGEPLVQSRLATQFGVSRAPLREALHRLEEEGFVKTVPYKGTAVAPLTHQNVAEIRSLRTMLEEFAGQLIIDQLPQDKLEEIEAVYRCMRAAATTATSTPSTPRIWRWRVCPFRCARSLSPCRPE